jgi:diketogulonate reductase-like aldo/keto reductase
MSYGTPDWQGWVLGEQEAFEHIKYAYVLSLTRRVCLFHLLYSYDAGITTFDTANMYSNGLSEVVLGKALKKYNIPREDVVIMSKVFISVVVHDTSMICDF